MKTKKEMNKVELSPKQIQQNLEKLSKELETVSKIMTALEIPEEILEREIKPFGNASHIVLPKGYEGKKAKVIIKK